MTTSAGIITSAGSGSLTVCGTDGRTRVYSVNASSSVTVNGTVKTLSSQYKGCYVSVTAKNGIVIAAAIESESGVTWVQGVIYSRFSSTALKYLYLADLESGETTKYTLSSSATVTLDGTSVDFSSIASGSYAMLKIKNGEVSALTAATSNYDITGTIQSIVYGTTVALGVADANGTVYQFYLNISNLPGIYRGTTAITIDRLSVGDEITLAVKDCKISSIVSEDSGVTVTGELTSITTTVGGTKWTVESKDGTTSTYTVDVNAGVYSGTTSILLSSIQAGDTVSLVVYGSTVTEINLVTPRIRPVR